jgi:hypothetical protein
MSIQGDIEAAIVAHLETEIVGAGNAITGSLTQPKVEGSARYAAVRRTTGAGARLEHGQVEWSETFAVTVWWSRSVTRATAIEEWEDFAEAILADQYLTTEVTDAWVAATAWGDAADSPFLVMSAAIQTQRVE